MDSIKKILLRTRHIPNVVMVCSICVLAIIALFILLNTIFNKKQAYGDAYEHAKIGDTKEAIIDTMKCEPDAVIRYKQYYIIYYYGKGPFSKQGKSLPSAVGSLQELPFVYDAMQFMFDSNNRLVAKGWCDETQSIVTKRGTIKGSDLSKVEEFDVQ